MTLDATARLANVKDSLKKYFIDTIQTGKSIDVLFDKSLSAPDLQSITTHKWISILLGETQIKLLSDILVMVYCCTRKDNEGFKLLQLRDTIFEALSVDPTTDVDNFKRIPFYRSMPKPTPWVLIGSLLVQDIIESEDMIAPDETKYRIMTVRLRTPSQV
jgi:hypothetical protein